MTFAAQKHENNNRYELKGVRGSEFEVPQKYLVFLFRKNITKRHKKRYTLVILQRTILKDEMGQETTETKTFQGFDNARTIRFRCEYDVRSKIQSDVDPIVDF